VRGFVGRLYHGIFFDPHFLLEDGQDLGTAVCGNRSRRKHIRFAILKILEDPTDIVFEPLGQLDNILFGEQRNQVRGFGRIASKDLDGALVLENTWDLIAGQKHGDAPVVAGHPFHQFLLGVRIGPIHLIQQ